MRWPSLIILFLAIICFPLPAQEEEAEKIVANWYRDNPRAAQYENIRSDIKDVIVLGKKALLPEDALIEFLNEAVSKGIPASQIVTALKKRTEELVHLRILIEQSRACLAAGLSGGEYATPALLSKFALLLRRGISPEVIEAVLGDACAQKKDFAAVLEALRMLANIPSLGELPKEKIVTLGTAVLGSSLSPSGYTALNSFYIKAKLKNLKTRDITDIIITALKAGKGLIRIEQELNRQGGE